MTNEHVVVPLPAYVADAFVDPSPDGHGIRFTGNPAGVVVVSRGNKLKEEACQAIAAELRHSETAFVSGIDEALGRYSLRWFTPTNEVPLCGHATLATARCLDELLESRNQHVPEAYVFETASGDLVVGRKGAGDKEDPIKSYTLGFPRNPPVEGFSDTHIPEWVQRIIQAVGLSLEQVEDVAVSHRAKKLLVVCRKENGEDIIKHLSPDNTTLLGSHSDDVIRGVSVMCWQSTDAGSDGAGTAVVYSRYFAPWNGIPEDPVNGSSHTVIGAYMTSIGIKGPLKCVMLSPRGGQLLVEDGNDTVSITGACSLVTAGTINLPRHFFK